MQNKIKCDYCGSEFERAVGEINRSLKLGRAAYCSRECHGKANHSHLPITIANGIVPAQLVASKPIPGINAADEYTPFRQMFRTIARHAKERQKPFEITLDDLKRQWELQSGVCPVTGWALILPRAKNELKMPMNRASLDRIDNNSGYTVCNIRFVALIVQYAKSVWSDTEVFDFCSAVVKTSDQRFQQESHSVTRQAFA